MNDLFAAIVPGPSVDPQTVWFHAGIFTVGFIASLCRLAATRDLRAFSYVVGVCGISGFTGFATVAVLGLDGVMSNPIGPYGVAALCGMAGKEMTDPLIAIGVGFIRFAARKMGVYEVDSDAERE